MSETAKIPDELAALTDFVSAIEGIEAHKRAALIRWLVSVYGVDLGIGCWNCGSRKLGCPVCGAVAR